MKARTFASVAVMTALGLLAPIHAHAFGLGKIELSSSLNEPFKAEIAVTALRGDDEGDLRVQLASNSEFEKAGLKRSFLLTQLKFEVVENNGETKIEISSSQPVKEPFIDLLLTATTGNGRLIREYTVLLDPPKNVFVKSEPALQQKKSAAVKTKAKSTPQKSTYKYPDPEMPTSTSYSSATSYGPVGRTDTLSQIAKDTKPSSAISLNQMMMAILNANPESFTHENINGLKAGYTLDIPSIDEIHALSKNKAYAAVKQQHDFWKNRNRVVAEAAPTADQENTSISSANSADDSDIKGIVSDTSGDDARLQLVVPHDESSSEMDELAISGNKELTQLSEQLTLAQETIESQTQENIDIKSRMDMMEEQLQTLRRLMTLKDADLARMQSSLDAESIEAEMTELDSSEAAMTEAELTEAAMAEVESTEAAMAEVESTEAGMTEAESTEIATAMVEVESELEETLAVEVEELSVQQTEVEAYFSQIGSGEPLAYDDDTFNEDETLVEETNVEVDSVMEIDTTTKLPLEVAEDFIKSSIAKVKAFYSEYKKESLIGGLAAALFALILLLVRRKRSREEFSWDDAETTNTTVNSEQADSTEEQGSELVSEATEETETSADKTDKDIIMDAYASLEDIDVDLDNHEETISELEQEELNITEEINSNLEGLNDELVTDNTLEDEQADLATLESGEETSLEFNTDELSIEPAAAVEAVEEISEEENADPDDLLEFNVDSGADNSDEEEALELDALVTDSTDNDTLDFGEETLSLDVETEDDNELNLDDESLSLDIDGDLLSDISLDDSPVSFELPEDADGVPTLNIDVDSDIPEVADLSEVLSVSTDEPVQEESEVEFDLGDFDEIDEAETKLDLAGAYMDMGDPEGARNILEEVLIDGNDEQKSRAQSLLNELS